VITPLPQETIAWLHQAAAAGVAELMVLRHVMQRLDALETSLLAEPIERETLRSVFRSNSDHHRRLLNLEAAQQQPANPAPAATEMVPTSKGAPVATDDELFDLFHQHDPLGIVLRAIYNLGRQHGAAQLPAAKSDLEPTPPAAPAEELVERVATRTLWDDNATSGPSGRLLITACPTAVGTCWPHWLVQFTRWGSSGKILDQWAAWMPAHDHWDRYRWHPRLSRLIPPAELAYVEAWLRGRPVGGFQNTITATTEAP